MASPRSRKVGNEDRLMALGDAIDRRTGGSRRPRRRKPPVSRQRRIGIVALSVLLIAGSFAGGAYLYGQWRFEKINNLDCPVCKASLPSEPFNILSIGSDSRAGLTGQMAHQTGAGSVGGQRSDVIKIIHVDPQAPSISVISIPRDTLVTLIPSLQKVFGSRFQRINVNLYDGSKITAGPAVLARTITQNFGIPINHVVEVSFGGLANSVIALGGIWLKFPYKSRDMYSGLRIYAPGCQHLSGMQALAVARSRHFEWFQNGRWYYDGTSDYGRIHRQDAFLRAMMLKARTVYNPQTLNSLLSELPAGIQLDSSFKFNTLIALAVKFHNYDPGALKTYTLPVMSPGPNPYGSVLVVNQPAAQQLFVKVFGTSLIAPTTPPPNSRMQTPPPPVITIPTTTSTVPQKTTTTLKKPHTTTTMVNDGSYFDPVPCFPGAK
ncbi:MAG: LCP family protein [Acidobacteria bacterium]|nr:LCP family protein [Acidobacteriota bacterium]